MTTHEAIDYEKAVINSAKGWVNGEVGIDNQMELLMISEHYGINTPYYCQYFRYSNSPIDLCCTEEHKSLYKLLDRLKAKIIEVEQIIFD
jgi:hypothetical protein